MSLKKLDIGCGTRKREGFDGVDISDIKGIKYPKTDARSLPIKDKSYNEIYSQWVLEHFQPKEIIPVLKEWNRVLVPGGTMTIITNNQEAINVGLSKGKMTWEEWVWLTYGADTNSLGGCHKIAFTKISIIKYLDKVGFTSYSMRTTEKVRGEEGELKCPGIIITTIK